MQKVIICGVNTLQNDSSFNYQMEELKNLCEACEMEVVDIITQKKESFNKKSYVGKGKIEEISTSILATSASGVVFNDELSPNQINFLEDILEVTIYDRTFIILEIFKRRAQTKEANLQIQIASLRYLMPRLVGLRSGLSRQRGGSGGLGGRGQGETQLEIDRRNIGDKISLLKQQLKELTMERSIQREKRKKNNMKVVSLVGYTNSGKSTTLNSLLSYSTEIKKEVFEKDMLFATLETSTRVIKLPNNHEFLVTDTVGFIDKLPHQLVEAFKSTLEEIKDSDLILHVVDASDPNYEEHIKITNQVLEELEVSNIETIYVFNKIDLLDDYFYVPPAYSNAIRVSAKEKNNFDNLLNLIEKSLYKDYIITTFKIPYNKSNLVNQINSSSEVIKTSYEDDIVITARVSQHLLGALKEYVYND